MGLMQPKEVRDSLLADVASSVPRSDLLNFHVSNPSAAILRTPASKAGTDRVMLQNPGTVKMVLALCGPLQILNPVVGLDPVEVITLQPLWTWANKGFKNQRVDVDVAPSRAIDVQADLLVAGALDASDQLPNLTVLARPSDSNVSEVGNLVPSFVTNHWEPTLFGHLSLRQTDRMKAAATRYGSERSGATLAATRSLT